MSVKLMLGKWSFAGKREAFYGDLAEALNDNGDLVEIIESQLERLRRRDDVEVAVFEQWLTRLDDHSFPDAIRDTVPSMDVMILSASEAAGNLNDGLSFLALAVGATNRMRKALTRELAMPVVLALMLVGLILMFAFLIAPQTVAMIPIAQMPLPSQALHTLAAFLQEHGVFAALAALAITVLVRWLMPRWVGPSRLYADRYLPVFTIYRDYTGAVFLVALAALMRSGVGLAEALYELRSNADRWLRWHIDEILYRLDTSSDQPAKAFTTGVFSQRLTDRVEDFGKRSYFEDAIGKVGLQAVDKVVDQVTISASVMKVVLMFAVALTIVFILGGTGMAVIAAATAVSL
ncbi:hypothetical protein [Paracidovorax citrulli]